MERHVDINLIELFGARRPSRWVTRERPKIDRIACPWLIRRFMDPQAEFLYVSTAKVFEVATEKNAVAFDIPGAEFSHDGGECSFDAFLKRFSLSDPGLMKLAPIIRGADNPEKNEIAPALMQKARVDADNARQCAAMGDLRAAIEAGVMAQDDIHAELGDVLNGKSPGRTSDNEIFVFDSTGTAVQDLTSARLAYQRAIETGVGQCVNLGIP